MRQNLDLTEVSGISQSNNTNAFARRKLKKGSGTFPVFLGVIEQLLDEGSITLKCKDLDITQVGSPHPVCPSHCICNQSPIKSTSKINAPKMLSSWKIVCLNLCFKNIALLCFLVKLYICKVYMMF